MTLDQFEAALAAAYLRGIDWVQDNGYSEYRHKAAADYADRTAHTLPEVGFDVYVAKAAEKDIIREYELGNLTPLGVANQLRRAGFNLQYAADKANSLNQTSDATADLLDACQEALRFISNIDNSHKSVRQLRAAIAKATEHTSAPTVPQLLREAGMPITD